MNRHSPASTSAPLTAEQHAAVHADRVSVAVVAGAGCGKTKVLTDRFLRHLESPGLEHVQALVALTFTEKAARELRDRVRGLCRKKLDDATDAFPWRTLLWALEAAPICTFHSYCTTLLRRFPLEAAVEPGFQVLDETLAPSLREDAVERCLERWLAARDPGFQDQALTLGLSGIQTVLVELISQRAGRDYRAIADRSVDAIVADWNRVRDAEVLPLCQSRLRAHWNRCRALTDRYPCSLKTMNARLAQLRSHERQLGSGPLTAEFLDAIRELTLLQGVRKTHWPTPEAWEEVREALTAFRKVVDQTLVFFGGNPEADRIVAEQGRALARLAAETIEEYDRLKAGRGLLDFTDLQDRILALLRDGPAEVVNDVRDGVAFLLVDEFQDTDPVQAEILRRLAGESLGAGRLFLVGDAKQSIYGFRGARPALLELFRAKFPPEGRLRLTENFRSEPEILDFVNALFEPVFPDPEHRLRPTRKRSSGTFGPRVELLWAAEADPDGSPSGAADARATEARWLAQLVARRISDGWDVSDPKTDQRRPAIAGDVVFLFRTLNDSAAYERALSEAGLDFYMVGGSAFFAQQEIIDLINLLSAIEDGGDELALAGSLRCPAFGVSDNGLYWLATSPLGSLPRGLAEHPAIPELRDRDRRRADRAGRLLGHWRALKDDLPMARLLERVLEESGYEAIVLTEPLGERKQANCRKLVELARQFDRQGGLTLADLVARLKADRDRPPREELASTTDEYGDAVRLMTIHQAKGLEFPIVVLPDLNRKSQGSRDRVSYRDGLGLVASTELERSRDDEPELGESPGTSRSSEQPSLGWLLNRELGREEDEQEAHRLFYVATTRARDYLILSAGLAPDAPAGSHALKLLDSRFDRRTGEPRGTRDTSLETETPRLGVILDLPESTGAARPSTRPPRDGRPSPLRVAATIERARPSEGAVPAPSAPPCVPALLDLTCPRALPPRDRQLTQLIRRALRDPAALSSRGDELRTVLERAAEALVPRPSRIQVDRAWGRMARWLEEANLAPPGRALATLSGDWTERRILEAVGQPPRALVLLGATDLIARDRAGRIRVIQPALGEFRDRTERSTRLQVRLAAARVASRRGAARVSAGIVWLSADGSWVEDEVDDASAAALERDLGELAAAEGSGREPSGLVW